MACRVLVCAALLAVVQLAAAQTCTTAVGGWQMLARTSQPASSPTPIGTLIDTSGAPVFTDAVRAAWPASIYVAHHAFVWLITHEP